MYVCITTSHSLSLDKDSTTPTCKVKAQPNVTKHKLPKHFATKSNNKEQKTTMGILYDDVVIIKPPEKEGDPTVVTVNCPDKTGLGCDLCRIILFFGLNIVRGGMFTLQ
jgi:hypothetical protein